MSPVRSRSPAPVFKHLAKTRTELGFKRVQFDLAGSGYLSHACVLAKVLSHCSLERPAFAIRVWRKGAAHDTRGPWGQLPLETSAPRARDFLTSLGLWPVARSLTNFEAGGGHCCCRSSSKAGGSRTGRLKGLIPPGEIRCRKWNSPGSSRHAACAGNACITTPSPTAEGLQKREEERPKASPYDLSTVTCRYAVARGCRNEALRSADTAIPCVSNAGHISLAPAVSAAVHISSSATRCVQTMDTRGNSL